MKRTAAFVLTVIVAITLTACDSPPRPNPDRVRELVHGYYVTDMTDPGDDCEPQFYIFNPDGELVIDEWFDDVWEWQAENGYTSYSARRGDFEYGFKIRDRGEKLFWGNVSYKGSYIDMSQVMQSGKRDYMFDEVLNVAVWTIDFYTNLSNDYQNTIGQISLDLDAPYNGRYEEYSTVGEFLESAFDSGYTLNEIYSVYVDFDSQGESSLDINISALIDEDGEDKDIPLSDVQFVFEITDGEWTVADIYWKRKFSR
ncbi:MAG: hypothetical protein FWG45_03185 [Oscillospiraceae bacterium]|nr:hypothetical protein [Oscillospiraceae bacterium]